MSAHTHAPVVPYADFDDGLTCTVTGMLSGTDMTVEYTPDACTHPVHFETADCGEMTDCYLTIEDAVRIRNALDRVIRRVAGGKS